MWKDVSADQTAANPSPPQRLHVSHLHGHDSAVLSPIFVGSQLANYSALCPLPSHISGVLVVGWKFEKRNLIISIIS